MPLRIADAATAYPVSLAEAKAQLRVVDASNDVVIKALIPAATKLVQSIVQRVYARQTLEWVLTSWRRELLVPVAPVAIDDVSSIKYVDWTTQSMQTLDRADYVVQTRGDSVAIFPRFGTCWPIVFAHSPEPIVVTFDAGYEPADVPENVKVAIMLQIRHLYSMGEANLTLRRDLVIGVGEKQYELRPEFATMIPDAVTGLVLSEVW
ncbi:MAG: hypothetical protein J0H42_04235 [Rhizobiales bacterium]|nr:hypothetical protein [Hyphomicrobiales bacterium]